jgi:hypothetical protein
VCEAEIEIVGAWQLDTALARIAELEKRLSEAGLDSS